MTQSFDRSKHHDGADHWVAIVDDDGSVRRALARLLRMEGVCVATFATSQEFLAGSGMNGGPSCLVLDVHLGSASRMSGFELHDHLAELGAKVKIVMMTAHDEVPSSELARRVGAENFLRKPFESETLVRLVQKAIDASTVQR
jgi:FixJ family two-component response regulator